jgi:hypothetical protein
MHFLQASQFPWYALFAGALKGLFYRLKASFFSPNGASDKQGMRFLQVWYAFFAGMVCTFCRYIYTFSLIASQRGGFTRKSDAL